MPTKLIRGRIIPAKITPIQVVIGKSIKGGKIVPAKVIPDRFVTNKRKR